MKRMAEGVHPQEERESPEKKHGAVGSMTSETESVLTPAAGRSRREERARWPSSPLKLVWNTPRE